MKVNNLVSLGNLQIVISCSQVNICVCFLIFFEMIFEVRAALVVNLLHVYVIINSRLLLWT